MPQYQHELTPYNKKQNSSVQPALHLKYKEIVYEFQQWSRSQCPLVLWFNLTGS